MINVASDPKNLFEIYRFEDKIGFGIGLFYNFTSAIIDFSDKF